MREALPTMISMAMEFIPGQTVVVIRDNGEQIECKDMVVLLGVMDDVMKGNIRKIKKMVK